MLQKLMATTIAFILSKRLLLHEGLHSFRTKIKLKLNESVCKNHEYCAAKMPET